LIRRLLSDEYDIIGYPRLVRLNPNVPWKTRGNGALSFQVGKGKGLKIKIGQYRDENLFCYSSKMECEDENKYHLVMNHIDEILTEFAHFSNKNTNPGVVLLVNPPHENIYQRAVREILSVEEVKTILSQSQGLYKEYKNGRGLIGALAAASWPNVYDKTYELISYRMKKNWGLPRDVDDISVQLMDKKYPETFDNYDYDNHHNRIVPNSPCPILFGIRGEHPQELIKAQSMLQSEKIEQWILFETNQGTDDHIQKKEISQIHSFDSVVVQGTLLSNPSTIQGGHVIFKISDSTGSIDCAAYEPTKQFRSIIRELFVGDVVEVFGGVRNDPMTINLEKIRIVRLLDFTQKIENPFCKQCGKHMKSKGRGQGYKCLRCGKKSDEPILGKVHRNIRTGYYEVPVCARRHLVKPLKRIKN
jgi:tRNA(Ile2)-agmatinylcytidine synthase